MTTPQIIISTTIVLYLIVMLLIGFFSGRKEKDPTAGDFFLGGRKMGALVTAMSAEASDMSSYLLMGLPGLAYLTGLADVTWTAIGLAVGTYLNWLIVSRKLRRYSIKVNAITIPEFYSRRYHDEKNILSCIAAIVIIVFFVPYTASGFKAIGTLFNSLFGVDYHVAMLIGGLVVVAYTIMGGFAAVSLTDLVQSIFMTISLIVMVLVGVNYAGGWANVAENAKGLAGYLSMSETYNAGVAQDYSLLTILSTTAWGLGYFGMPHILVRFMAIKDEKKLTLSRRIGSIWVVIAMGIAILIGIIGNAVSAKGIVPVLSTSSDSETIIIKLAELMSNNGFILAIVAGVVMAGILACTMSTADSQLLSAASSVSHDLLENTFGVKMTAKQSMLFARLTVVVVAIIGALLAWNPNSSVFTIVSFAWAGFGAAFGPAIIYSLFWKRTNIWGMLAGMVSGGAMVFIWKFLVRPLGGAWNLYELLPAFIVSAILIPVVSLLTAAPDQSVVDEFNEVSKKA